MLKVSSRKEREEKTAMESAKKGRYLPDAVKRMFLDATIELRKWQIDCAEHDCMGDRK